MTWRELTDTKSGRKYYYNSDTKKTQWKKPSGYVATESTGGTYYARQDPKRGKTYYINTETRETTWSLPKGAKIVEKPKKKKSNFSSKRGSKTSSRSPIVKERVHISPDGTVDITETRSGGSVEKIHVEKNGSVDISEHRRGAEDILSKYRKSRSSPSSSTSPTLRSASEKIHVSPRGSIDIGVGAGGKEKIHIGKRGSIDVTNMTSSGTNEKIHIGRNGDVTIRERSLGLNETVHVGKDGSIDIDQYTKDNNSDSNEFKVSSTPLSSSYSSSTVRTPINRGSLNTESSERPRGSPYDSILYETRALTNEPVLH